MREVEACGCGAGVGAGARGRGGGRRDREKHQSHHVSVKEPQVIMRNDHEVEKKSPGRTTLPRERCNEYTSFEDVNSTKTQCRTSHIVGRFRFNS